MEIQGASSEIEGVLALIRERMGTKITGVDRVPLPPEPTESGFVIAH